MARYFDASLRLQNSWCQWFPLQSQKNHGSFLSTLVIIWSKYCSAKLILSRWKETFSPSLKEIWPIVFKDIKEFPFSKSIVCSQRFCVKNELTGSHYCVFQSEIPELQKPIWLPSWELLAISSPLLETLFPTSSWIFQSFLHHLNAPQVPRYHQMNDNPSSGSKTRVFRPGI